MHSSACWGNTELVSWFVLLFYEKTLRQARQLDEYMSNEVWDMTPLFSQHSQYIILQCKRRKKMEKCSWLVLDFKCSPPWCKRWALWHVGTSPSLTSFLAPWLSYSSSSLSLDPFSLCFLFLWGWLGFYVPQLVSLVGWDLQKPILWWRLSHRRLIRGALEPQEGRRGSRSGQRRKWVVLWSQ